VNGFHAIAWGQGSQPYLDRLCSWVNCLCCMHVIHEGSCTRVHPTVDDVSRFPLAHSLCVICSSATLRINFFQLNPKPVKLCASLRGPYVLRDSKVGAKVSVSDLTATTLSAHELKEMDVSRILIYLGFNAHLHPLSVGRFFKLLLAVFVRRLCAQLLAMSI